MWLFYLLSIIPLLVGAYLWATDREVVWWEWVLGFALSIFMAATFHFFALWGMPADVETGSGQISRAVFYPRWVEEYQEAHTRTVSDGDGGTTTETYYTTEHRTHEEYWEAETTLGDSHRIDENFFNEISRNFKCLDTEYMYKSGFDSGDHNIYVAANKTGYVYPVTATRSFENRIKAAPTVFSFPKPPKHAQTFPYPRPTDWLMSNRLLGTAASSINMLAFDRMQAALGPVKHVNVIIVGFGDTDDIAAQWQRAAWVGGKKNDLVVCYGGSDMLHPTWVNVFGWSESDVAKRKIETLFLTEPVTTDILPKLQNIIMAEYVPKDWHKFDYITITPPTWAYVVYFFVMVASQFGFWFWARSNSESKDLRPSFRFSYR